MKEGLSIIIANYNGKDLLRNCLNSIIENIKGINYEIKQRYVYSTSRNGETMVPVSFKTELPRNALSLYRCKTIVFVSFKTNTPNF